MAPGFAIWVLRSRFKKTYRSPARRPRQTNCFQIWPRPVVVFGEVIFFHFRTLKSFRHQTAQTCSTTVHSLVTTMPTSTPLRLGSFAWKVPLLGTTDSATSNSISKTTLIWTEAHKILSRQRCKNRHARNQSLKRIAKLEDDLRFE